MKKIYRIEGLHCHVCVDKIRTSLAGLKEVKNVLVDMNGGEVQIHFSEEIPVDKLNKIIGELGEYRMIEKKS